MSVTKILLRNNLHKQCFSADDQVQRAHTLPTLLLSRLQALRNETAIADSQKNYSFEETVLRAITIAITLRRQGGVRYNDCVGLFIEASADLALGMWGILFAGAAYLPLATDYPPERLSYMLNDARVKLILSNRHSQSYLAGLPLPDVTICNIDDMPMASFEEMNQLLVNLYEQDGTDLAYVIYTSGTTGKPKGVLISQQAIVNQLCWIAKEGYLDHSHRILQKTPISFDAAQWELLGMCCGACVVIAEPGSNRDPESLVRQIKQHEITTLQGVPTLLQALSELNDFSSCHSLHSLFSGGEGLSRKLARCLLHIMPKARLGPVIN
ncbi:AMP-binding protein [Verminephrobacter aporrectodeae]|uniref:AMP-binding protein n=1 Tax=Verminephrobacter aporrectodeae TaxID=1110389 RepID=UPI0022438D8C|nr:AMP-binding protein [Verminephrobacter aporrectodeae]MCW8177732.1 hypothetical protein [Verminephrobacter aporrectodeae subsp. tuberculatae]MCW8205145.1 hypothetical protein [Verminephrobacter aporrectodeae subsp. tuberculatae]